MPPKQLNKDQVNNILKNAPAGVDKTKLLDGLVMRGYQLEGIDSNAVKARLNPQENTNDPSYIERLGESYKEGGDRVMKAVQSGADALNDPNKNIFQKAGALIETGLNTAGAVAGAAFAPIVAAVEPALKPVVEKALSLVPPEKMQGIKDFIEKHPKIAQDGQSIIDLVTLGVGGTAEKVTKDVVKDTALKTVETLDNAVQTAGTKLLEQAPKIIPDSSEIMNRVARLKPTDATQFEKMAGKTHGEYLKETGNFGTPDKIIENEATKFSQSIKSVDAELSKLPGSYKDGSITDALSGLVQKAKSVSGENVKSPYLDEVIKLQAKNASEGLSMEEVNQVKRLFEKEVKLGYKGVGAQINPEAVQKATNIDTALRKWQVQKAEDLGFTNISDLNKQTQISKFIIDKLGDQVVGKNGLNGVGLSDWVILAGGDPTAVGTFLTKKFFSSKSVQAKIAQLLNKNEIKGQIKPNVISTPEKIERTVSPQGLKQLPAGQSPVIENRVPITAGGKSTIEKSALKIYREPTIVENQILLPERAGSIQLPKSVTQLRKLMEDIKTGKNEILNAKMRNPSDRRKVIKLIQDQIRTSKPK